MQKVILIAVGRVKTTWLLEGCKFFAHRLQPAIQFEFIEITDSRNVSPVKHAEEESQAIVERLKKLQGETWLLEVKGKTMTSEEFSKLLSKQKDSGTTTIFILGGAYGVTDTLKNNVQHMLSLSEMTLPHELCQLVFMEQLYRAIEIEKGSGYHH